MDTADNRSPEEDGAKPPENLKISRLAAPRVKPETTIIAEANRLKEEFVANISHEIRTPVNVILGYADLLREQLRDAQQQRYLDAIAASAHTLMALMNDILDLSKLESNTLDLDVAPVNVRRFLHEVYDVFASQIKQKGLEFQLEIDNTVPMGLGLDERRLRQILFNIIGNAAKFTEQGFVRVAAYYVRRESDAEASPAAQSEEAPYDFVIEIADSGIGIADHKREKIFQMFWQGDGSSTRRHGGTGLGLAVTKRLVERMNGVVSLTSRVGSGSNFRVTLRDARAAISEQVLADAREQRLPDDISFGHTTVLLADDAELDRQLLADILKQANVVALQASSGRQAMELIRLHEPQAVFAGLSMPDVNAADIAFVLKNDKRLGRIPVIAVANDGASRSQSAMAAVVRAYKGMVKKPFQKREVISALMHALPYTTGGDAATAERYDAAAQPVPAFGEDVMTPQGGNLPELLELLQGDVSSAWSQLRSALVFDDIEAFAHRLLALGKTYQTRALSEFASELAEQAQSCDMKRLPVTMEYFPVIVERLGARIVASRGV